MNKEAHLQSFMQYLFDDRATAGKAAEIRPSHLGSSFTPLDGNCSQGARQQFGVLQVVRSPVPTYV